jgi:hypothetical protein
MFRYLSDSGYLSEISFFFSSNKSVLGLRSVSFCRFSALFDLEAMLRQIVLLFGLFFYRELMLSFLITFPVLFFELYKLSVWPLSVDAFLLEWILI